MTGLEKILAEIQKEAAIEASAIIDSAAAKAKDMIAEAEAKSMEAVKSVLSDSEAQIADIKRAGKSALDLQRRRRILATKQELIAQTMGMVLERLKTLPLEEYFRLIISLANKAAQPGNGKLLMSSEDMQRMPLDFKERLQHALPEGSSLELAASADAIDGGFILSYQDVEINCSFKAIMAARRDEFEDIAQRELFL